MAFKSIENEGGLMIEGDYECICLQALETSTRTTGVPVIKFDFQVRSDVEQKYQRKHIFKNFYQDEAGNWPDEKIGKMAHAMGVEKGADFDLPDLVGRCCILHMKPFTGQDGVTRDSINYFKKSAAEPAVQSIEGVQNADGYQEVEEEDLPF